MKLFSKLYAWTMRLARHPQAPCYLAVLSFAESSIFPIPPDVMLMPMVLAKPERAWYYATLTTVASVLGGLFGYWLGMFCFQLIHPVLLYLGYGTLYQHVEHWFDAWGFWIVFVAGFSPIPYKVFTVAAGVIAMPLVPFTLASLIGRGARFFLVAGLMYWGGAKIEGALRQSIDYLGWAVCLVVLLIYVFVYR